MRDRRISLTLCRTFSTVCPDGTCTRKANCPVFNCPGGQDSKNDGGLPHSWLAFGFCFLHTFHPSSWGKGFLSGSLCTEENLQMTNPDSRCLAEVEGQPGPPLLPPPSTGMTERARGCMSQSPASYFLPVVQALPRSFLLCGLFLNRSSCLCAGFLRRKGTVQWVSPLGGVGGKGGRAKCRTHVQSCIIYEICIKSDVPSGTINTYSIFES